MARSEEQNRRARERARESILTAAIEVFAERGVHGATIAEITGRAGVAQGLVNYHFGGKDQLVGEVVDRWFRLLIGFPMGEGSADDRLRAIIEGALAAASAHRLLHRAVMTMQQDPAQLRFFAEAAARNADGAAGAEQAVRAIFAERGAADPALEEVMLRTLLEGVALKYSAFGEFFPLDAARGWVLKRYGLEA
ncbi:TetR/AcrR family transcriptional regulator [Microbacterium sp. CIAB417]|uniref:TetR/AcrR family transcriptional regulator n=1 Tax=Microbacterium sp. CIAB417 TaxID=2860287 RepID=UPI001FAC605A|nr:TetR/AcrR family transcriptional regulator [Microbacterium sp. CIAB417]